MNDKLVVADPSEHPPYESVVWTSDQKLTAPDDVAKRAFGSSVALSSKFLVVGADFSDEKGVLNSGVAYVYAYDDSRGVNGNPKKLTADDPGKGDSFGLSVAASRKKVFVGTLRDSVYVYEISIKKGNICINHKRKLTKNTAGFGRSLAASRGTLVVGATKGDGTVYVYKAGREIGIPNPDAGTVKNFGWSVAISGDTLVVGTKSNRAYVYDLSKI